MVCVLRTVVVHVLGGSKVRSISVDSIYIASRLNWMSIHDEVFIVRAGRTSSPVEALGETTPFEEGTGSFHVELSIVLASVYEETDRKDGIIVSGEKSRGYYSKFGICGDRIFKQSGSQLDGSCEIVFSATVLVTVFCELSRHEPPSLEIYTIQRTSWNDVSLKLWLSPQNASARAQISQWDNNTIPISKTDLESSLYLPRKYHV
jgi:hypothetical protein